MLWRLPCSSIWGCPLGKPDTSVSIRDVENIKGLENSRDFQKKKLKIYSISINLSHRNFSFGFTFNMEDEEKLNLEKKEDLKKKTNPKPKKPETAKELNFGK